MLLLLVAQQMKKLSNIYNHKKHRKIDWLLLIHTTLLSTLRLILVRYAIVATRYSSPPCEYTEGGDFRVTLIIRLSYEVLRSAQKQKEIKVSQTELDL